MKRKLTRDHIKELPLRPYPGFVLVTRNRKAFERAAKELFDREEKLTTHCGRFLAGPSWWHPYTYLVWWSTPDTLAHEMSHVILNLFETVGIDPICGGGEPFCYLLSQLVMEATQKQ